MTTSYTAGTVSVSAGSRRVTGTGTGWKTANVAPGLFGLAGVVGGIPVDGDLISDTEFDLVQPWPGPSLSGQAYWLSYDTRDGQQTVNNAQRLAEYLARLASPFFSAVSGLVPAANTFPYFGAGAIAVLGSITAAARSLLGLTPVADTIAYFNTTTTMVTTPFGAAARALLNGGVLPNAQLPGRLKELVEITTNPDLIVSNGYFGAFGEALNVPHAGGTWLIKSIVWADPNYAVQEAFNLFNTDSKFRRHKVNQIWQPWKASGQVTVGNAARINTLPTGALIERGSNGNGQYNRFADGTLECWHDLRLPYNSASDLLADWTFPSQFSSTPNIQITNTQDWPSGTVRSYVMDTREASKNPVASLCVSSNPLSNNQPGDIYVVNVLAKGRWF